MDQPRVAVVGEDDRLVGGEHHVEVAVGQPVRMLGFVLQAHQVDDVDEPDLEFGQMGAQQIHRGQRLEGRDVAGRGEYHVGIAAEHLAARPLPDAHAAGAVCDRLFHGQEIRAPAAFLTPPR